MTDTSNHDHPRLVKYPHDSALERIRQADHAWFRAHPDATQYVRELLPGEFEAGNRAPYSDDGEYIAAPPPGYKWMVHVYAWRHPIDGSVMMRMRKPFLVPVKKEGYAS